MKYDLVIRDGTIVDGTGTAPYRADLGIVGDRITRIGRITETPKSEIAAEGHVVTPGFVDAHTHMDTQIFWDPLGSSSCWHGVTSVVMGNCGFTLAPTRPGEHELVIKTLEHAEDVSREAMSAGIEWDWETFPEYLDSIDRCDKAINYAAQIGHSALRTFAMGERAFFEPAGPEDVALMRATLREALRHGAAGFSTSLQTAHKTSDDLPVASRLASWSELSSLVEVLGEECRGVFQIAVPSEPHREDGDVRGAHFLAKLRDLAVESGVPTTFGILRFLDVDQQLKTLDETHRRGGRMYGLSRSVSTVLVFSFRSQMPFDRLARWQAFRSLPLHEQLAGLRDEVTRKALIEVVEHTYREGSSTSLTNATRTEPLPSPDLLMVLREGEPERSVTELAQQRGLSPVELMIELAIESNLEQVFARFAAYSDDDLLKMMRHPRCVMTFSDSGAHVSYHSGAELHTTMLANWVRERGLFSLEQAVQMMTFAPARAWQLKDRGLLRENMLADVNVFDPDRVALAVPTIERDLPAGALRVRQKAVGYRATIVNGVVTLRDGESTGANSGRLLRTSA